jgi:hypothetical protein
LKLSIGEEGGNPGGKIRLYSCVFENSDEHLVVEVVDSPFNVHEGGCRVFVLGPVAVNFLLQVDYRLFAEVLRSESELSVVYDVWD